MRDWQSPILRVSSFSRRAPMSRFKYNPKHVYI